MEHIDQNYVYTGEPMTHTPTGAGVRSGLEGGAGVGPQGPGSAAAGREDHLCLRGPHQPPRTHPPPLPRRLENGRGRGGARGKREGRVLQEGFCRVSTGNSVGS